MIPKSWILSPGSNDKQCEPKMASAAREHWDLQRTSSGLRCNPAGIAVHRAYTRIVMVITPDMAALQPRWLPNYLYYYYLLLLLLFSFVFSQHATRTRIRLTWWLKLGTSVRSSICQDQYCWSSFRINILHTTLVKLPAVRSTDDPSYIPVPATIVWWE